MCKKHYSFVLLVAAITLISLAANLRAENIYLYNFNNLQTGTLVNSVTVPLQDNWLYPSPGYSSPHPAIASGAAGWDGNYVTGQAGNRQESRVNDSNWSYSIDPALPFDLSFNVRVGGIGTGIIARAGLEGSGSNVLLAGVSGINMWWYIDGVVYSKPHGISSTGGDASAKIFLVGAKVSPIPSSVNFLVEPYYQNLTDGGSMVWPYPSGITATPDSTNWNISAWNALRINMDIVGTRLDNIRISQIPEPGTLALLAAGLVGLLCYAWRKRK